MQSAKKASIIQTFSYCILLVWSQQRRWKFRRSWWRRWMIDQSVFLPYFHLTVWSTWIERVSKQQIFFLIRFKFTHRLIRKDIAITFVGKLIDGINLFVCNPVVDSTINWIINWVKFIKKLLNRNVSGFFHFRVVLINLVRSEIRYKLPLVRPKHDWCHKSERSTSLDKV